jgi:phage terminase small subunit
LTDKQRRFVDAYAQSRRGKDAAIAAGFSPTWASSAASRLLKQPEIAAALKRRIEPTSTPKPAALLMPLEYLLSVMNDLEARDARRVQAAKAALPYCHAKPAIGGKKDERRARPRR